MTKLEKKFVHIFRIFDLQIKHANNKIKNVTYDTLNTLEKFQLVIRHGLGILKNVLRLHKRGVRGCHID